MTAATIAARSLPDALRRGLGKVARKIRVVALVRGLGLVAIAMAALAAAGMAADFLWPLPIAARWAIWGGWVAAVATTLVAATVAPLLRRLSYDDLAAVAERGNPHLGERIVSAVGLLGARDGSHGSPTLIAALGRDAESRAAGADLAAAVSTGRAVRSALAGLAAVGLVAAPMFARPDPFRLLAHRFLMPWADVDRVARFVVAVAPGDAVVAVGSDVEVVASVRPRFGSSPETARLEWTGGDGEAHRSTMTPDEASPAGSRTFRSAVARLPGSVVYRVVADSSEGRRHTLTAVEPPAVVAISARVEPPSYTKRPAAIAKDPARIEAWEGSSIAVTVAANRPLAKALLEWPAPASAPLGAPATRGVPLATSDGGTTWTASVPADVSGTYTFAFEDCYKLTNRPEPPRRLVVRPDAAPTIALGGSSDPKDAQGDDLLVVEASAQDDLGVMTSDLLYAITRTGTAAEASEGGVAAPLEGLGSRSARGEASLSLGALGLRPGDVLAYRVRVADNRPAPKGPNATTSAPRLLRIVAKAEPLLARERSVERQALQDGLDAIKKAAAENRQGAESLRYAADAASRGNGAWGDDRQAELARRESAARSVADKLQLLARDFAESGRFAPLARPARQVADVEAEGGREKLDDARRSGDPAKRLADLRAADDRLAAVQARLDELQKKFDELARLDDDRRKLRELAEKQEELARRADELAKSGDPGALERLRQEQDRLRRELDEIARRSPELRAEALAARAVEADELAGRARKLAERQRDEARKTADPSGRAAKLKALAEAQRGLEDDARRLALQVDRPLEENGRGRLDAAALARAVEPIERGEIEQGRQKLEEAEDALRRLGRDLEDVRDDPKSLARRLARRQDALGNQVTEIVREARDADQKQALAEKLKPFADREHAIEKLASALPVPENLEARAKEALQSLARSGDDLKTNKPDQTRAHMSEARDRLGRLADAMPDANERRQGAMRALNEAKSRTDQVAREIDNSLRDTAPRPGRKDFDPEAAARELARRVAPLAERQAEAVRHLASLPPDPRAEPQRDRALRRAQNLADALDALRDAVPPEPQAAESRPAADWRILGPFDDAKKPPPFAIDRPIDLKAAFDGRKGSHPTWKPIQSGGDGRVDLGSIYSKDNDQSAFAYAEITSPTRGKGRLLVGSDDYLTIWINGKRVHDFNEPRSWGREQDRVDVMLEQGENRLLVRCGNVSSEWQFSVAVRPPKGPELAGQTDRVDKLRAALPALKADATAALGRLEQKMQGREPADDLAADLAADLKAVAEKARPPDAPGSADEMRRVATALRNLQVPDALAQRDEAVRSAERAATQSAANAPDAEGSRAEAAKAADALARRLADTPSPREGEAGDRPAEARATAPDDPDLALDAGHVREARALARRERQIRERLQGVMGERVAPQEAIRDASDALGRALADLRDGTREVGPKGHGPANAAADMLQNHAPKAMDEGVQQLAAGRPDRAREAQRRAAEILERAAQQAEDLAGALRAEAPADAMARAEDRAKADGQAEPGQGQGSGQGKPSPADLASAREAQRQASKQLAQAREAPGDAPAPATTQAASEAMRQAARGLRAAASQGKASPSRSGRPGPGRAAPEPSDRDPQEGEAGRDDPHLAELKEGIKARTGRSWGELPGHLRSEILQMSQGKYRDDYARLIGLYFREIAAGREQKGAKP